MAGVLNLDSWRGAALAAWVTESGRPPSAHSPNCLPRNGKSAFVLERQQSCVDSSDRGPAIGHVLTFDLAGGATGPHWKLNRPGICGGSL